MKHGFDDCARFLVPDEVADRLVIGSVCSIGSGAAFIMAGNQGRRADWVGPFPFYRMSGIEAFAAARNGCAPAGDAVIGDDVWIGSGERDLQPRAPPLIRPSGTFSP